MSNYEWDIFVSYRRSDQEWVRWTQKNFVTPLRTLLSPAFPDVKIFTDHQVETGASWPLRLANALGRSRLLIPVLSHAYFDSKWCRLEIALVFEREKELGFRTGEHPGGLILPVVIQDDDNFPTEVREIQAENIHRFANPFIQIDSPQQQEFTQWIHSWCPTIERSLKNVPPFNAKWDARAQSQFEERFRNQPATPSVLPRLEPDRLP
jgi:TIR domain